MATGVGIVYITAGVIGIQQMRKSRKANKTGGR